MVKLAFIEAKRLVEYFINNEDDLTPEQLQSVTHFIQALNDRCGCLAFMLASIFNKVLESCADTYTQNIKHDWGTEFGKLIDQFLEITKLMFKNFEKKLVF